MGKLVKADEKGQITGELENPEKGSNVKEKQRGNKAIKKKGNEE